MNIFKIDMNADSFVKGVLVPLLVMFFGSVIFFVSLLVTVEKTLTCPRLGISLEKETKYDFLAGGCFLKLSNGNWISADKYSGVNLENK